MKKCVKRCFSCWCFASADDHPITAADLDPKFEPQIDEQAAAKLEPAPSSSQLAEEQLAVASLKDKVKELTVENLDALLVHIEAQLKRLDPARTSSSTLVANVLSECQKQKDVASCFVKTLPQNLTKEVSDRPLSFRSQFLAS